MKWVRVNAVKGRDGGPICKMLGKTVLERNRLWIKLLLDETFFR